MVVLDADSEVSFKRFFMRMSDRRALAFLREDGQELTLPAGEGSGLSGTRTRDQCLKRASNYREAGVPWLFQRQLPSLTKTRIFNSECPFTLCVATKKPGQKIGRLSARVQKEIFAEGQSFEGTGGLQAARLANDLRREVWR